MIDTIKLHSPTLTPESARAADRRLYRHTMRDNDTGAILRETSWRVLPGPWGVPVRMALLPDASAPRPYLVVEASIHKLLASHNVTGGTTSFQAAGRWFTALVADMLDTKLPSGDEWLVERADWAETYRLPASAIQEFFDGMNSAHFPRRQLHRFGNAGLAFRGGTTTVTLYHKGPEFDQHDLRRMSACCTASEVADLRSLASNILRAEVSVKSRKFTADFRGKPRLGQVMESYLPALYDRETAKLMATASGAREIVRTEQAVERRLTDVYGSCRGQRLFGLWCLLARHGGDESRSKLSRATFYRNRRLLLNAGCSWLMTDVRGLAAYLPTDFSLARDSPYRLGDIDDHVEAQLYFFSSSDINVVRERFNTDSGVPNDHNPSDLYCLAV